MCKCKVCNRQFHYGDEWSPMFTNKIWFDLLDFYNLWRYAAEAEDTFRSEYTKYKKGATINFVSEQRRVPLFYFK